MYLLNQVKIVLALNLGYKDFQKIFLGQRLIVVPIYDFYSLASTEPPLPVIPPLIALSSGHLYDCR